MILWYKKPVLQLVVMVFVMGVILQVQTFVIASIANSKNSEYKTSPFGLVNVSADNEPGGLCDMSNPCDVATGGCRAWEKCVSGSCRDTTNGGANPPSADSCGSSGAGSNPTSVPTTGSNATAAPTGAGGGNACRTLTIEGTLWEADCTKKCTTNAQCPKRETGDTDPNSSNWCYGFSNGLYCLKRNQSGGVVLPTNTPKPGTTGTAGGGGAVDAGKCFSLGADVSKRKEGGKYKFDVSIKFTSIEGDGDVKLDRDGAHVAGWNGWNRSVKSVFTYSPQWTGGAITSSKNVTYKGTVANSEKCPNVSATLSCSFNVDNGSCDCGGASNCEQEEVVDTPQPTSKLTQKPTSKVTPKTSPTSTPKSCLPGEDRCWNGGPCAEQGQCPKSPTPTPKVCKAPKPYMCPDGRTCVPSKLECEGTAANTPVPSKTPTSRPTVTCPEGQIQCWGGSTCALPGKCLARQPTQSPTATRAPTVEPTMQLGQIEHQFTGFIITSDLELINHEDFSKSYELAADRCDESKRVVVLDCETDTCRDVNSNGRKIFKCATDRSGEGIVIRAEAFQPSEISGSFNDFGPYITKARKILFSFYPIDREANFLYTAIIMPL